MNTFILSLPLYLSAACLALSPWYIVRTSIAGIPFTLPEIIGWLAIGLWLVIHLYRRTLPTLPPPSWLWLLGAWLVCVGIAVAMAPQLSPALGIAKAYFVQPIALFLVLYSFFTQPAAKRIVVAALILGAVQVILLSLSQLLWQWPVYAIAEMAQGRPTATFNSANSVGLYLGSIAALALTLVKPHASPLIRWVLAGAWIGLCSLVLIATQSQGALLAWGISLTVLASLTIASHRKPSIVVWASRHALGVSVGLISLYAISTIGYMFFINNPPTVANPYTRPGFTTLTIRQCLWQGTVQTLSEQPLTGNGLAGFASAYRTHITCDGEPFTYPHNLILTVWSELGLVGLLLFLYTLSILLKLSLQSLTSPQPPTTQWGVVGVVTLAYLLVHGLVDVPYFKNDLSLTFWAFAALLVSQVYLQPKQVTDSD